jgi:hypothetical protein
MRLFLLIGAIAVAGCSDANVTVPDLSTVDLAPAACGNAGPCGAMQVCEHPICCPDLGCHNVDRPPVCVDPLLGCGGVTMNGQLYCGCGL